MSSIDSTKQHGSVSLFIVIFSALLIITVGTAYIRIALNDQTQATSDDLSKSALDSAKAGVEDAKRLILKYKSSGSDGCPDGPSTDPATNPNCTNWFNLMQGSECITLQGAGIARATGEVPVGTDANLDQAYTCTKVTLNTNDYTGTLTPGQSRIVPLSGTGSFDRVTIQWYSKSNLEAAQVTREPDGSKKIVLDPPALASPFSLPKLSDWPAGKPSLLRTQLLQYGIIGGQSSFKVSDFDVKDVANADTATLFMLPTPSLIGAPAPVNLLNFTAGYGTPLQPVNCDRAFTTISAATAANGAYGCNATIQLPLPVGATSIDGRTAYLRLSAPYGSSTSFRITLSNSSDPNPVLFNGVQPVVDSTGRAGELFRRVVSRVELGTAQFPYIDAALDVTGDLCKTFQVGDALSDYQAGTCTQ